MAKLTAKQAAFVREFLVDMNATRAAIRAGYPERSARQQGAENLSKPVIAQAIQGAMQARVRRTEVTQDYVLSNLLEVSERCMQRAPVRSAGGGQAEDEKGNHLWAFNAKGAIGALTLLGKHVGLWKERPALEVLLGAL